MNKNFLKECIKFNRQNVDHAYFTISKYQEHGEKLAENFFKLPFNKDFGQQGKEMMSQCTSFYKEGRENMKKMIDESFENAERIMD